MSDIVDAFRFLLIWFGTMVLLWLGFYFFEQYLMNTFVFESVPILGLVTLVSILEVFLLMLTMVHYVEWRLLTLFLFSIFLFVYGCFILSGVPVFSTFAGMFLYS